MFKIIIPLKKSFFDKVETEQVTGQVTKQMNGQKAELDVSKSDEQAASHTASQLTEQSTEQMTGQVIDKKTVTDIEKAILIFCKNPKSRKEIQEYLGKTRTVLMDNYIRPLLEKGKLELTIPDKPKSQNQKYITKSVNKKKD